MRWTGCDSRFGDLWRPEVAVSALREGMIERARVPKDRSIQRELIRRRRRWAHPVGYLVATAVVVLHTTPLVLSPDQAALMEPSLAVAADGVIKVSD